MKQIFSFVQKLGILGVMCLLVTGLSAQNINKYRKDCKINSENQKYGIVFQEKQLVPFIYDEIVPLTQHVFRVKEKDKYGLLNVGFEKQENCLRRIPRLIAQEEIERSKYYIFFFLSELCIYDSIELCCNNFISIYQGENKGLMNRYGDKVIPCKFNEIICRENVYYVRRQNQQGVYNRYGDIIVPCQYTRVVWQDDVYYVQEGRKYGVINKYGDRIVPCKFDKITREGNFYYVNQGNRQGIYNRYGDVIVPCQYTGIVWEDDVYYVQAEKKHGVINKYGNVIVPCQYDGLTRIKTYYCVEKRDLYGVYNKYGNNLLPCTFDSIDFLRDGKFLTLKGGKKQLYNSSGSLISDYSKESVYYSTSNKVSGIE